MDSAFIWPPCQLVMGGVLCRASPAFCEKRHIIQATCIPERQLFTIEACCVDDLEYATESAFRAIHLVTIVASCKTPWDTTHILSFFHGWFKF